MFGILAILREGGATSPLGVFKLCIMPLQYALVFARRYWLQLMLPVTIPIGCYWLESRRRSRREVEPVQSVVEQREERRLQAMEGGGDRGVSGGDME